MRDLGIVFTRLLEVIFNTWIIKNWLN